MFLICAGLLAVCSWQEFGDKPASSIQTKADHDKLLATKTIAMFSVQHHLARFGQCHLATANNFRVGGYTFKFMLQASMQPDMHLLRNVTIRRVDAYHTKLNGVESCTVGIKRACS